MENIKKIQNIPDGEPEVIETESDANFIEDMMNMSVNLDRLPKEMTATTHSYDWKGRISPNQSQLSETLNSVSMRDFKEKS